MAIFKVGETVVFVEDADFEFGRLNRIEKEKIKKKEWVIEEVDNSDDTYILAGLNFWVEERDLRLVVKEANLSNEAEKIALETSKLASTIVGLKEDNQNLLNENKQLGKDIVKLNNTCLELKKELSEVKNDMKVLIDLLKPHVTDYLGKGRKVSHIENI